MLYSGLTNIRDCIAFPKTAKGTDLMTGAPGTVDARQLKELHIRPREALGWSPVVSLRTRSWRPTLEGLAGPALQ